MKRIYGLPDHWECPCGCGDYISYPLQAETRRRQVLGGKDFMDGVQELLAGHLRGDRTIASRDLKRK